MSHTAPLRSSWTCMVIVGTSFSQHQRLRQDLVQKRTDTGIDAFADRASVVLGGQCVRVQFGLQWRRVLPARTVKFALLQAQTICGVGPRDVATFRFRQDARPPSQFAPVWCRPVAVVYRGLPVILSRLWVAHRRVPDAADPVPES